MGTINPPDEKSRSLPQKVTMRSDLRLHPDSRCSPATHIDAGVALSRADGLLLSYTVTGAMRDIRMPSVRETGRGQELWRHTCFEAFLRSSSCGAYYEFNFAPSTQWAAYRFSGYRSGMTVATIDPPFIQVQSNSNSYTLQAKLNLDAISDLSRSESWRIGLSGLIEDRNGVMSYWALAHPPGRPDFHHVDCFVHELFLEHP